MRVSSHAEDTKRLFEPSRKNTKIVGNGLGFSMFSRFRRFGMFRKGRMPELNFLNLLNLPNLLNLS